MKVIALILSGACLFLLTPTKIDASETVGIYTIVERVVLEPNDQAPQRIQLWGVFATNRDTRNPKRGYMYFTLPATRQEAAQKEWADFKKIAGTGQAVSFGMEHFNVARAGEADRYHSAIVHVRPASEKPQSPDIYPLNFGIQQITDASIVDSLKKAQKQS